MLHTDKGVPFKVGRGCTIGHRALLHGCIVGDNCLIGIGATILNNTVIGDNCLIRSAHASPEGKSIPAGSVVIGSPGKIVPRSRRRKSEASPVRPPLCERARRFRATLSEGRRLQQVPCTPDGVPPHPFTRVRSGCGWERSPAVASGRLLPEGEGRVRVRTPATAKPTLLLAPGNRTATASV